MRKRVRPITLLRYYGWYHRCLAKKRWPITLLRYYGSYYRCLEKKGSAHYVITLLRLISSLSWDKGFGALPYYVITADIFALLRKRVRPITLLRYYGSDHRCLAKKRWPITLLPYYGKYHRCLEIKGSAHYLITADIFAVLRKGVRPLHYYVITANIIAVLQKTLAHYVITAHIIAVLRKRVRPITLLRLISSLSWEKAFGHYVITADIFAVLRKTVRPIAFLRYYGSNHRWTSLNWSWTSLLRYSSVITKKRRNAKPILGMAYGKKINIWRKYFSLITTSYHSLCIIILWCKIIKLISLIKHLTEDIGCGRIRELTLVLHQVLLFSVPLWDSKHQKRCSRIQELTLE